jgi:hypothetical protein
MLTPAPLSGVPIRRPMGNALKGLWKMPCKAAPFTRSHRPAYGKCSKGAQFHGNASAWSPTPIGRPMGIAGKGVPFHLFQAFPLAGLWERVKRAALHGIFHRPLWAFPIGRRMGTPERGAGVSISHRPAYGKGFKRHPFSGIPIGRPMGKALKGTPFQAFP